jgi:hypothetical protein
MFFRWISASPKPCFFRYSIRTLDDSKGCRGRHFGLEIDERGADHVYVMDVLTPLEAPLTAGYLGGAQFSALQSLHKQIDQCVDIALVRVAQGGVFTYFYEADPGISEEDGQQRRGLGDAESLWVGEISSRLSRARRTSISK